LDSPPQEDFLTASEGGYLTIFDTAANNKFTAIRCVKLFGDEAPISAHTIAVDLTEETVIISMTNNRVITLTFSNGEPVLNAEEKPFIMPFHEGAILSCTACCRKFFIATYGTDNTVRV
jgi:hypothetical protein